MKRTLGALAAAVAAAALTAPTGLGRGEHRDDRRSRPRRASWRCTSPPTVPAREGRCFFKTQANLLTPDGPIGLPQDTWARQTITLRSTDRYVWQEAWYSAPAGMPRELKGANHDNVLSKGYKSLSDYQLSITYFGGGPLRAFRHRRRLGADRLGVRPTEPGRRFHRVLEHPGGVRRGERHHPVRVRPDDLQLARAAVVIAPR